MIGSEASKESVLPVLLAGTEESSFPALLQGRVYADFRKAEAYFLTAFDLVLSLYGIQPNDPAVADLRESLVPNIFIGYLDRPQILVSDFIL